MCRDDAERALQLTIAASERVGCAAAFMRRVCNRAVALGGQADTLDHRLYSSIRVPLLTLAEYAGVDSTGKLFIAGGVERVTLQRKQGVPADVSVPFRFHHYSS